MQQVKLILRRTIDSALLQLILLVIASYLTRIYTPLAAIYPFIVGGLSWDALRYGAFKAYSRNHPDDLVYVDDGGIGMIDDVILDSHFR